MSFGYFMGDCKTKTNASPKPRSIAFRCAKRLGLFQKLAKRFFAAKRRQILFNIEIHQSIGRASRLKDFFDFDI